jgi:mono/diheme cytochrome c family protein
MRIGFLLLTAAISMAADPATLEKGRAEEKRSCIGCHGLRIVHAQRLSRGTWERELVKMEGWGAKITDRAALLDYLVSSFGDDKPVPEPPRSQDSSGSQAR